MSTSGVMGEGRSMSYVAHTGNIVDHSLDFRRVRGAYLADVAVETNKVVIRVEKVGVS